MVVDIPLGRRSLEAEFSPLGRAGQRKKERGKTFKFVTSRVYALLVLRTHHDSRKTLDVFIIQQRHSEGRRSWSHAKTPRPKKQPSLLAVICRSALAWERVCTAPPAFLLAVSHHHGANHVSDEN